VNLRSRRRPDGGPHRPRDRAPQPWSALVGWVERALRRRRRIRPTREGWVFLGATLAVALAALNTGNNLLYLVFATQLAMVTLSGVLSELSVQQLRLSRRLGTRLFARIPARGTWSVRNPRTWLPSLAITVSEAHGKDADLLDRGLAQLPVLAAATAGQLDAAWTFRQRGVHRLSGVRVATTWPFGIFEKYYELSAPLEVLVHPEPRAGGAEPRARSGSDASGAPSRRAGDGTFLGLRDHREGEDPRRVHWRTSARRGRLVAAEHADHLGGDLRIVVEAPRARDPARRVDEFEESLSRATAEVLAAERNHRDVELLLPGAPPVRARAQDASVALAALAMAVLPGERAP
jgi:uncharacterized protein (DUF58 family)